jgi:L-threonylcarbamoyladenylate synthase
MPRILSVSDHSLAEAAAVLRASGLVGMPTETVYGLAANALDGAAVARVYEAKGRPSFNPLIVHCADLDQAQLYGVFDERAIAAAQAFWPGPLTLVVKKALTTIKTLTPSLSHRERVVEPKARPGEGLVSKFLISELATAGLDTIALRIPAHPAARALIAACGFPLVAPSANPSGGLSPTTPAHVAEGLGDKVDLILAAGACKIGLESTVLDLSTAAPEILRPGAITAEQLSQALGTEVRYTAGSAHDQTAPKSPGLLLRHYAPNTPLRLNAVDVDPGEALLGFASLKFMGVKGGGFAKDLPETHLRNLSESGDLHEAAANLFAMLKMLDAAGAACIAVMPIPDVGLGVAINDRLRRGAL